MKKTGLIIFIWAMAASICYAVSLDKQLRNPIPVNTAEAVLEIFWDPDISDFSQWEITPGEAHGLKIFQNWGAVDFQWTVKPKQGPALQMKRQVWADCSKYDSLILSLTTPQQSIVKIIAGTDKGAITFTSKPSEGKKLELLMDLNGARIIEELTLEIYAQDEGISAGWLNWIMLQNSEQLKIHLDQWNHFDDKWIKHLKSEDYQPSFDPAYGIFLTKDEVDLLRDIHKKQMKEHGESYFSRLALSARNYQPEKAIKQFARGNTRLRDDNASGFSSIARKAAVAAIVLKDKELLRIAARNALSLAVSQYWDHGFNTQFPLSGWELRAFKRSYCMEDTAWIMDLAGELFTTAGRRLVLRKLSEEGAGPINFCTWRHEYIFDCNQLAFFNTGRMAGYLVLEREYPRVKSYTDIAFNESIENIERAIASDGGYYEGPGYFSSVVRRNCMVIQQYAKARGVDYSAVLPEILKRTDQFACAIASTTDKDHLAICDGDDDGLDLQAMLILAALMPDSYWVTMSHKMMNRMTPGSMDPFDLLLSRQIPPQGPVLPEFVFLPETGYMCSHRKLDGKDVKLFIMGNMKGADHCHEDKGSFILEYAGDCFAVDIGIGSYKDPLHFPYKHCQRHNMLVPIDDGVRVAPKNPIPFDIKPVGQGDSQKFAAEIDASVGWNGYYKKWVRRWNSPSPDLIIIEDEYELSKGKGVEFYWQTLLPCKINGRMVEIQGKNGTAIIEAPEDCGIRIEQLPMQKGAEQNRIAIRKLSRSGTLKISVRLQ